MKQKELEVHDLLRFQVIFLGESRDFITQLLFQGSSVHLSILTLLSNSFTDFTSQKEKYFTAFMEVKKGVAEFQVFDGLFKLDG